MSIISITKFKGLELKSDGMVRDPATASVAKEVIIYKGAIVNFPYPSRKIDLPYGTRIAQSYVRNGEQFLITWDGNDVRYQTYANPTVFPAIAIGDWYNWGVVVDIWDPGANFTQIGEWVYLCKRPADWYGGIDFLSVYPGHMIKFRDIGFMGEARWFPQLVGMEPPSYCKHTVANAGSSNGNFDIAIAYKETYFDLEGAEYTMESRALPYGYPYTYLNHTVRIKAGVPTTFYGPSLYPPFSQPEAAQKLSLVIYTKLEGQAHYYYTKEVDITNFPVYAPIPSDVPVYWIKVEVEDINPEADQDIERVAVLTGRGVPRTSYHMIEYKGRVYYANRRSPNFPHMVQVSEPLQGIEGVEANYIEDEFPVGNIDEEYTGFEVFLGQLIIFKESSTWVLTDTWGIGTLRPLFNDKGCVCKVGGKGTIVIDDTLYFVDRSGVYAYDGQTAPVKISTAIDEALDLIKNAVFTYVRLAHFQKYKLLLVTIQNVTTYVYHYEIKEWTELADPKTTHYLPDRQAGILGWLYNKRDELVQVQDSLYFHVSIADPRQWASPYNPTWTSTLVDNGDINRFKHLTFGRISMSSGKPVVLSFIPGSGSTTTFSVTDARDVLRIQRQFKKFKFGFSTNAALTGNGTPFMINGIEVEGHYRGRH